MKTYEIKYNSMVNPYSVIIGNNAIKLLPIRIRELCPKTKKIALFIDSNVPQKFKKKLNILLKKYELHFFNFNSSEKNKSLKNVNNFLELLLLKNFNRTDLVMSIGGGISGDVVGFISSIFINIPTTLLAQVDAAIGGKTAVNSKKGKNLIGSFHQPKLVLTDTSFLNSLPKKEIICGYAEILKHAIIKDKNFF